MFTEGTPWGAVLNPTLGALIKPEIELHPLRFRNGIDLLSLLHNANDSIRQQARDYTRTNYLSIKNDQISAVQFNNWNAPTPDTHIMSTIITDAGMGAIYDSVYGIYGSGEKNQYFGAPGGSSTAYYPGSALGKPTGSGYQQNLAAGFNSFEDDTETYDHLFFRYPKLGQHLLTNPETRSFPEALRQAYYGIARAYSMNGDIIQDQEGNLGFYQNRPIKEPKGAHFTFREQLAIDTVTHTQGQADRAEIANIVDYFDPVRLIGQLNTDIKVSSRQHIDSPYAVDEGQGYTSGKKLSSFNPTQAMDLLNDADTVSDLLDRGNGSDFVRSAGTSIRLIAGIYGYMGSELVGLGVHNEKILANSSDMYAFNRKFWDLNLGGAGGAISEIGRRFIPNFQRSTKQHALLNQMPDWLPEKYRYGDPYSLIPHAAARLPGKGYESLNELHPDIYGEYGAFDRMKILADIAPNSPEYKMWREIAKRTVTDPYLMDEMEEIKSRARQQGKKHDFYPYQVIGKDLDYKNIIISEVLDHGKFRSGNIIYKIAGITVKGNAEESAQDVLSRYLHPGQEVTIAVDTNSYYSTNKDLQKTTNAAVYLNGESLSEMMLSEGDAQKRKGDKSAAATFGSMSGFQRFIGYTTELVGHLDIPIISDQWLRIRSPYESYLAENVYGTPYQSWSHPIDTFLWPAVERAIHDTDIFGLLREDLWTHIHEKEQIPGFNINILGNNINIAPKKIDRNVKHLLHYGFLLSNRASIVGYSVANMLDAGNIKLALGFSRVANYGVALAHMATGGNSFLDMGALGAYVGSEIARINEISDKKTKAKFAIFGAVAGMAYRAIKNPLGDPWIPQRVKDNWDMQDYFDRLNYIKYTGLYHEAARKAKLEEGVDVETALNKLEYRETVRKANIKKLQSVRDILGTSYGGKTNSLKDSLLKLINSRISELQEQENLIEGGKYTQSAIIYRQAARSTIYGLKQGASWSEIVSALPQNDREYFMEFVAEQDPDKRDQILSIVSPSLKKALQMSWGMRTAPKISNDEYFTEHYLPDKDWMGWRPNIDINDTYVKTIDNEAMNLADFGFYENQLREPGAVNAMPLPYRDRNRDLKISSELQRLLQGNGLHQVEVSVAELNTLGPTEIMADIGVWAGITSQKHKVETTINNWY